MKKGLQLAFTFFLIFEAKAQNIGIGTDSPNPSSALEISSNNKGLLIPRMTTTQRNLITSPAKGLMVYDSTSASFWLFNGTAWDAVQNTSSNPWQKTGADIYNSNSGFIGMGRINPSVKLDVLDSTHSAVAKFAGGDNMWITLAEKSQNRGYIGSYSGNPEDVDFGTYNGNNSGRLHLTTFNIPRLTVAAAGNIGIANGNPDPTAALDVYGTSKGMLMPRLTTLQREAIADPAVGLLVYDLNYKTIFMYDGFTWMAFTAVNPAELKLGKQTPEDIATNDKFGYATGVDSLYSIIGAPYQNGSVGAAYIYKKTNNVWAQMSKLSPDVFITQLFGKSVAIDFPYAVVGAPSYNGSQGAVYIFYYNGSDWLQVNKFFKPGAVENAQFGNSVDIDNLYMVAGAPLANNVAAAGGAAFTYRLSGGIWSFHNTLTHASIGAGNSFGFAAAISDSFIVIGSPLYDNGTNTDEGRAYRFRLSTGGTWNYQLIYSPFWDADHYDSNTLSYDVVSMIDRNWIFKKFGYAVDIQYNKTGTNLNDKLVTVIGAPESAYRFNSTVSSGNMGLAFVYTAMPNSTSDIRTTVLYNQKVPDSEIDGELFGASLALSSYKGNLQINESQITLSLLVGSPGYENGSGRVGRYKITKDIETVALAAGGGPYSYNYVFQWPRNYRVVLQSTYSDKTINASTGFSCGMFDINSYAASLLGVNQNSGGVIFKF